MRVLRMRPRTDDWRVSSKRTRHSVRASDCADLARTTNSPAARQHDELKKEISALKGHVAQRDEVIQQHKRELNTASQDKRELMEVVEKRDKQLEVLTGMDCI